MPKSATATRTVKVLTTVWTMLDRVLSAMPMPIKSETGREQASLVHKCQQIGDSGKCHVIAYRRSRATWCLPSILMGPHVFSFQSQAGRDSCPGFLRIFPCVFSRAVTKPLALRGVSNHLEKAACLLSNAGRSRGGVSRLRQKSHLPPSLQALLQRIEGGFHETTQDVPAPRVPMGAIRGQPQRMPTRQPGSHAQYPWLEEKHVARLLRWFWGLGKLANAALLPRLDHDFSTFRPESAKPSGRTESEVHWEARFRRRPPAGTPAGSLARPGSDQKMFKDVVRHHRIEYARAKGQLFTASQNHASVDGLTSLIRRPRR